IGMFDLLEDKLNQAPTNNHYGLLNIIYPPPAQPCVISTNYDLIIDTAMMSASEHPDRSPEGRLPDYRIRFCTPFYGEGQRFGTLLKLHGSLNWLHCRTCQRIEIGGSASKRFLRVLARLIEKEKQTLEQSYTPDGNPCPSCGTHFRPLLIAPTHFKDYRNPHL